MKLKSPKLDRPEPSDHDLNNMASNQSVFNTQTRKNAEIEKVLVEGMTTKFVAKQYQSSCKHDIKLPQILSLKQKLKQIDDMQES